MEFIKQWTYCVCLSLIIAVIFSVLSPKGSMNRFYKVLISIFVFISFIIPFRDFRGFDFDLSEIGITDELQISQNTAAENLINGEIKALLDDNGIVGAKVSSSADYNLENGEITVDYVQVSVPDEYNTDDMHSLIFEETGINARVINVGS